MPTRQRIAIVAAVRWSGRPSEDNLEQFMKIVKEMKLPMKQLRGFATNVANYQPLG